MAGNSERSSSRGVITLLTYLLDIATFNKLLAMTVLCVQSCINAEPSPHDIVAVKSISNSILCKEWRISYHFKNSLVLFLPIVNILGEIGETG